MILKLLVKLHCIHLNWNLFNGVNVKIRQILKEVKGKKRIK